MQTLYEILGCNPSANVDQILAEYRVRVISAHPDKIIDEKEKAEAQKRFHTLQYAKEILCDPSKRKYYDTYLAMGSRMPLKEWMDNQDKLQQTLHWASPTQAQQMLESSDSSISQRINPSATKIGGWVRHESPTLSAFRNYKI
uniref:J domain-containing protein n=1 Tax=Panagrolaimus sp. PS1159 TaxID=55785 RepID=A0AC35GJF0_9BILA